MFRLPALLTVTCSLVCCVLISSSCTRETQDELDDWIAREIDMAIKELPDQNIPRDLCGEWERAENVSECQMNTKSLMINTDGKLSGIKYIEGEDGGGEYVALKGLCHYDSRNFSWAYIYGDEIVSTFESKTVIHWDSEALIIGRFGFCSIFSRSGDPIDSEILSNRDSRLFGKWKCIGGESRIVFNPDGTGSFNGEYFRNWFTTGDYIIKQYTHMADHFGEAYRFSGDTLKLDCIDPTLQDWNDNMLDYVRE